MLRLRVAPRAAIQIQTAARWWKVNRTKAPAAFFEDLSRTLAILRVQPDLGMRVANPNLPGVRRVLLERVRYYLYYCEDDTNEVLEVLALWHSSRDSKPDLGPGG
ncbi:MAG: type II toxin-antitoxin system RelE/ParE family toxin [Thermoanaerobaculia bacterium]